MGDRGNIVVNNVWLYTHWGGSEIKRTLQKALQRHQRWEDGPYLTRIIFCEMLDGDIEGETGFGISLQMCDNEYNILYVDTDKQEVTEKTEEGVTVNKWKFREYVELKLKDDREDD